jgi:release factor glutamine methyltransferase
LLVHPERSVTPEQAARFEEGIARLAAGEPLPYLTGLAEFYELTFHVTPATLIPRPETEHLVEAALDLISAAPGSHIADVGTGSGCIAVTLAVHRPDAHLYAIDRERAALEVAARNARRHDVAKRITFLEGHLLRPLPGKVHLVVANLPYVADHEWDELPVGVREHEPAAALRGGVEGLDLIEELLRQAPAVLHPDGALLLEIGAAQGAAALALVETHLPDAMVELRQDYAGRDRLLLIQLKQWTHPTLGEGTTRTEE